MNLRSLTTEAVMRLADSAEIFQRGQEYAEGGRVYQFSTAPGSITAKVHGNYGNYTVIARDVGEGLETECGCPYDGSVCKHSVAVLLCHLLGNYTTTPSSQGIPAQPRHPGGTQADAGRDVARGVVEFDL